MDIDELKKNPLIVSDTRNVAIYGKQAVLVAKDCKVFLEYDFAEDGTLLPIREIDVETLLHLQQWVEHGK